MSTFLPEDEVSSVPARMRRRAFKFPPDHQYPVDEWRLIQRQFTDRYLARVETLMSLSNGYLGMRGTHDEGRPVAERGTFINGFHETWPIEHADEAFGFATTGQTILNVPDARTFHLYVDDEPLYLPTADLPHYVRVLDMRDGTVTRELIWLTAAGKRIRVRSQRLVSFEHRHLAAFSYEITVLDASAPVVISSHLRNQQDERIGEGDPRRARGFASRVLEPQHNAAYGRRAALGYRVANSGMTIACAIDHIVETRQRPRPQRRERRGPGKARARGRRRARRTHPADQVRRLPHLAHHTGGAARRPLPAHAGPRDPRRLRRAGPVAARVPR